MVIFSLVLLIFTVMPNFAQDGDSNQVGRQEGVARISQQELREVLSEILLGNPAQDTTQGKSGQAGSGVTADDSARLNGATTQSPSRASIVAEKLVAIKHALPNYPATFSSAFAKATNPQTGWSGWRVLMTIMGAIIIGLLAELFTTHKLLRQLYAYVESAEKTTALKYKLTIARTFIHLIGVAVLTVVVYIGEFWFRHDNPYFNALFTECIAALVQFQLWMILLKNIFSPYRSELRPIPLDDDSARQIYIWFIVFFLVIEFGGALLSYMGATAVSEAQINGLLIPYTLLLNLIVISRIWVMRKKIARMFIINTKTSQPNHLVHEFLHSAWPFVITGWLISLWMLWLYKAFLGQWDDAQYASLSWWVTLAFFVTDRMVYGLVANVVNLEWLHSVTFETRSGRFIRIVQNGFRLIMVAVAVYLCSLALGLETDSLMEKGLDHKVFAQGINLLIIATIAYVIWEFFSALIERNLPQELDAVAALEEGDGGGPGATRAVTLLPLMRTCLTIVLASFLLLSVLNTLGVAITPLLAGAGVVGIAIGFGAQKLVQDVLSGIFFLVDDAFRKDEYIEMENLRGTVEKISLRSMQLRHHLGAVQTIPYGEIKTVKNRSRDWVTMKLELRLSYDTDIEKVRKIIKKIGLDMLKDENLGPSFILPLKSQGVMRVEESALIVRMKFTTIPGKQWVVRREAYRKARDALAAAGIFFAHREVRVRLADDQIAHKPIDHKPTEEELSRAAAGAMESMVAEEAEKKGEIDYDDEM